MPDDPFDQLAKLARLVLEGPVELVSVEPSIAREHEQLGSFLSQVCRMMLGSVEDYLFAAAHRSSGKGCVASL